MKVCPVSRYTEPRFPTRAVLDAHPELLRLVPERWRHNRIVMAALAGACGLLAAQGDVARAEGVAEPTTTIMYPIGSEVRLQGLVAAPANIPMTTLTWVSLVSSNDALLTENTTLLPVRVVAEWIGAQAIYDGTTSSTTVVLNGHTVKLTPRNAMLLVDGKLVPMDYPVTIRKGITYVQARPFADALGIQIGWDAAQRQVTVIRAANEPVLRLPVKRVHIRRRAQQVALTTGASAVTSEPEMAQLHARQALRTQLRDYIAWLKAENII